MSKPAGILYDDNAIRPDVVTALYTTLIDWAAFWASDHTAEDWLAWPLIPAGRQVALYAPAKSGKSWVTLAVCAAIATGGDILGERNHNGPRHVLYLDYEMTESDLRERLEALGYGPDTNLDHLHYALLPTLPPLNTPKGQIALCGLAGAVEAEAVVIDTMGRAVSGEENKSDSYREFAQTTGIALKQMGCAVLRTDHAGKDRERGQRGSSAKNDDVDVVLRLDPTNDGVAVTRTHSRVSWVPERTLIRHSVSSAGVVDLRIDGDGRPYAPGTSELVAVMRGLGITGAWSRRDAKAALADAGVAVRNDRLGDALRWMRDETARFGTETTCGQPVDNPVDNLWITSGTTAGTTKPIATGTSGGDHPGPPPSTSGDHSGDHAGPLAAENGDHCPPYKGGQVPTPVPNDDGWNTFLDDLDSGFYDNDESNP